MRHMGYFLWRCEDCGHRCRGDLPIRGDLPVGDDGSRGAAPEHHAVLPAAHRFAA
jgi:hypothetical protein